MKVKISADQQQYAWVLANGMAKEFEAEGMLNHNVFGKNDAVEQRFIGFIGETVFADVYGLSRPVLGNDGGFDYEINGFKVDIKTSSFSGPKTYLILEDCDLLKPATAYILLAYNDGFVEFHGWITKKEFIKVSKKKNLGYGLRNITGLKDLHELDSLFNQSTLQGLV